jgi:hypothetical protein
MDLTNYRSIHKNTKTSMITMLSNSINQQHNVNRLTCHITMKIVSAGSSDSMVGLGARGACAEMPPGSVEA